MPFAAVMLALIQAPQVDLPSIVEAYDRLAAQELWPGFEPATVPLLIFDGADTWLLRHPSPPKDFERVEGEAGPLRRPGRHEVVRANTSVDFAGARTATMIFDGGDARPVDEIAAVLLHEAFHVYQHHRHPDWAANEVDLLVYPTTDTEVYARRLTETMALQRALAAFDDADSAAWALRAIAERRRRFARLDDAAHAYERHVELHEGTARHLQSAALGPAAVDWLEGGFGPAEIRARCYASGHAWSLLLDRFATGWKEGFERGEARSLDEELARSLADSGHRPADLGEDEWAAIRIEARNRVTKSRLRLAEARVRFLQAPGWRVEVHAGTERPLWPRNFDPLNVDVVRKGEVLHRRWIVLGNDEGEVEVLDRTALTISTGKHPLFEGVSKLVVTGIDEEPTVSSDGGSVELKAEGLVARFAGAKIELSERKIVLRLD